MSAAVGSGVGCLWIGSSSWGQVNGREGVARRFEVDGGIHRRRFRAGDGIVCGGGIDVGRSAPDADGCIGAFVGDDGLRGHAAYVFPGVEKLRAGIGNSVPAAGGRSSSRVDSQPLGTDWSGAFPFRFHCRPDDVEPEVASIFQSHSE